MRATLWCQILAVELDEIVRILKLFFSLLYLIFEINIYKWADLIQIVCTGQNLVAMLKYKYLFFFYRISCITNNWKPMFCSMTFWWTVCFTRSGISVNTIFGLTYILSWKVVFLLILYVNLKCDIEYFFLSWSEEGFFWNYCLSILLLMHLLSLHVLDT